MLIAAAIIDQGWTMQTLVRVRSKEKPVRRLSVIGSIALLLATTCLHGCGLVAAGAIAGAAAGAASASRASGEHPYSPMTYAGTVVGNAGYVPAKILFAGAGAAASGVMYVVTV